jgi:polyisoprenyl-phosphate glycosyltransferase
MPRLSIITPVFNEAESLPRFRDSLLAALENVDLEWEVILVDDHSMDASPAIARRWVDADPRIKYVRLSRNCGSHAALSAGLAHASGDCAAVLAADLQDPPEIVGKLLVLWREGYDVVLATRVRREAESWWTRAAAGAYYGMMRRLAFPDMPKQGIDLFLIDRKVIDAYNAISEKNAPLFATILWMGFRRTTIEYAKQSRHAGRSKWTLSKKVRLFIDSIVAFSAAPIRMMAALGVAMTVSGFAYAVIVGILRATGRIAFDPGTAAVIAILLVGQGMILTMLGVLGEYLWRCFDETRKRPRYLIEEYRASAETPTRAHGREALAR